jgi:tRNA (adenine37-N6)-methyltransferase
MKVTRGESTGILFEPIGVIRSAHTVPEQTPAQPVYAEGCAGRAELLPEYAQGLNDLDGFSHIILIYHFHRAGAARMTVTPFLQDRGHGVFSTRVPDRPNPIGLSIVELTRREGAVLYLSNVDVLDGTPLLDIKPYVGRFDRFLETRCGWQDEVDEETARKRGMRGYRPAQGESPEDLP